MDQDQGSHSTWGAYSQRLLHRHPPVEEGPATTDMVQRIGYKAANSDLSHFPTSVLLPPPPPPPPPPKLSTHSIGPMQCGAVTEQTQVVPPGDNFQRVSAVLTILQNGHHVSYSGHKGYTQVTHCIDTLVSETHCGLVGRERFPI